MDIPNLPSYASRAYGVIHALSSANHLPFFRARPPVSEQSNYDMKVRKILAEF